MLNTPSISSLDDILKQAEEEIIANGQAAKTLTIDEVNRIWTEYAESLDSATTTGILKTLFIEIVNDKLVVTVPSNIAKEEIQQETALYTKLRDFLIKVTSLFKFWLIARDFQIL